RQARRGRELAVARARLNAPLQQERAARWYATAWVRVACARPHVDAAVVLARTPGLHLAHRGAAPDRMAALDYRGGDGGARRRGLSACNEEKCTCQDAVKD